MVEKIDVKEEKRIQSLIVTLKGQRVILDADLAMVYGVTTKRLNEQVKRNRDRFPDDFMFQLNVKEKVEVVAKCDHLARLKFADVDLPQQIWSCSLLWHWYILSSAPPLGLGGSSGLIHYNLPPLFVRLNYFVS